MNTNTATFHGRVYGKKQVRKESDLPADLKNASAATRRVFEPAAPAAKQPTKDKRSPTAKRYATLRRWVSHLFGLHKVHCMLKSLCMQ